MSIKFDQRRAESDDVNHLESTVSLHQGQRGIVVVLVEYPVGAHRESLRVPRAWNPGAVNPEQYGQRTAREPLPAERALLPPKTGVGAPKIGGGKRRGLVSGPMTQITESVRLERRGDIALVIINNPPVNALSHHVRQGIVDGVTQAEASDATAIVLICDGRTFIAGADITEFGQAPQGPSLQDAQAAMENCSKPVIAAIHGTALGGGLEVALCAHYRVAVADARFGLPEVKLGLLPGACGTQRLPRVVGVEQALVMMTSGDQIGTATALEHGLINEIVDDLEAGAVAFAGRAVAEDLPLLRIRDRNDKLDGVGPEVFAAFRKSIARKTRGFLAPEYNVQCVEAAVSMSFDDGLAKERELFGALMTGTQSQAQRYYFFAERAANKVPDVPRDTPLIPINSAGVLGA